MTKLNTFSLIGAFAFSVVTYGITLTHILDTKRNLREAKDEIQLLSQKLQTLSESSGKDDGRLTTLEAKDREHDAQLQTIRAIVSAYEPVAPPCDGTIFDNAEGGKFPEPPKGLFNVETP